MLIDAGCHQTVTMDMSYEHGFPLKIQPASIFLYDYLTKKYFAACMECREGHREKNGSQTNPHFK